MSGALTREPDPAATDLSGADGYADAAERFFAAAESVTFDHVHRTVAHLFPSPPASVLDIGAGSGRDAAALAGLGHYVVAIEPVAELRRMAAAKHGATRIEWLDGGLPELASLAGRPDRFDLVLLSAVWMHLDPAERTRAMPSVARRVAGGGLLVLSLRHGPVPLGRRMFDVLAEETVDLAVSSRLELVLRLDRRPSAFDRTDITWTWLAFRRSRDGA